MVRSFHLHQRSLRRAFTLMEALMATGILLMTVIAVSSAITAGQQNALEAHQRIAGTLAAEELMGRLTSAPYDTLAKWHGHTEAVGAMTDMQDEPMPPAFDGIGRSVEVTTSLVTPGDLGVKVLGRTVRVTTVNRQGRVLAELTQFIPEPQS